ncbi:MAG: hypothetical protein R6X35_04935 [Candidatus Krumholzibacteriia bacterium]
MTPRIRPVLLAVCVLPALAGCGGDPAGLGLDDLTPGEHRYVERMVVLERAKAVGLVDRPRGAALGDSLAAAWGDSALERTIAGLPADPRRAAAVGRLLAGILLAEQDSLVFAPRADRLAAPLPLPAVPAEPAPAGSPAVIE